MCVCSVLTLNSCANAKRAFVQQYRGGGVGRGDRTSAWRAEAAAGARRRILLTSPRAFRVENRVFGINRSKTRHGQRGGSRGRSARAHRRRRYTAADRLRPPRRSVMLRFVKRDVFFFSAKREKTRRENAWKK